MTREEIIDFCEMKSQLEPENEDIFNYIIKALEQEPCEDAVSRKEVINYIRTLACDLSYWSVTDEVVKDIEALSSVTPTRKKGKWIAKSFHEVYCDNCKFDFDIMTNEFIDKMKYCPNCGAKMEEKE